MASDALKKDDRFLRHLGYSVLLHVAVVVIFSIRVYFFPTEPLVIESAMRVDLVALPDKIPDRAAVEEAPPKKAEKAPAPEKVKPKPKDEKTVVLNSKKKQLDAINKLKQMSAIEELEKQVKKETSSVTYKGNQISKGSDLRGLSLLQHESYVRDVEKHIRKFWSIPQWLANKRLRAKVRIRFDESGTIVAKDLIQSSGNPAFDEAVLATLERASPVPKPPDKFQRLVAYEGVLVGFPE